jgi:hypothetical protein
VRSGMVFVPYFQRDLAHEMFASSDVEGGLSRQAFVRIEKI